MGIDDESSHPEVCSEVAGGVTRNIVGLFREPDAGNLPVRFDEREQETELRQAGLRRVTRKRPNSHREAKVTAPVLDSTRHITHPMREDVKQKHFSTPLRETSIGACIQAPSSSWRGFWF
jgi:hypothetical protein